MSILRTLLARLIGVALLLVLAGVVVYYGVVVPHQRTARQIPAPDPTPTVSDATATAVFPSPGPGVTTPVGSTATSTATAP